MTREITTPDELPDEGTVELSLRPQRLAEFIGQEKVKESLRIYIDAALSRHEPLDHTLFFGPPGLGKTTLAELMAREMGVKLHDKISPSHGDPEGHKHERKFTVVGILARPFSFLNADAQLFLPMAFAPGDNI